MATATDYVTNVFLLNSTSQSGIAYTCPADKYAEVYIQKIVNIDGNSNDGYIKVGEVTWTQAAQDSSNVYIATGTYTNWTEGNNVPHYPMGRDPIVLFEGQTIQHVGSVFNPASTVVAVIKEYNKPS